MDSKKVKAALLSAADWLEAHPSQHIVGRIAVSKEGVNCDPTAPEAECFCALGRFAKELDMSVPVTESGHNYDPFDEVEEMGVAYGNIYGMNDSVIVSGQRWKVEPACPTMNLSGPIGVKALRYAAEKIDE